MENSTIDVDTSNLQVDEMLNVYHDIKSASQKFRNTLDKCNSISWDGKLGLSLLDVKADTMLSYLANLTYLILKKICGQSIVDEDTRERLVHMRIILEKIKPLEEKLKYQIEKMVKTTVLGKSGVTNKNSYRANLSDLESSVVEEDEDDDNSPTIDNESGAQKKGIYKPPKLAAVPYSCENKTEKQQKLLENAKRRALNSTVMQELKEEYLDTPLEISTGTTLRNIHTKFQKERESYEETFFTRLPVTKKERHREKLMASMTLGTLANEITRFEDISALEGRLPSKLKKIKKSVLGKHKKKKGFKKRRTI